MWPLTWPPSREKHSSSKRYGQDFPFVAAVRDYRRAALKLKKLESIERRIMPDGRMHYELKIAYPDHERRCITTTADGFHVDRSQGYIRMEDCDFGYMGDDCVNIHDNMHAGIRVVDAHNLIAEGIVDWRCPFAAGDVVEIRKGDFSPTGFQGKTRILRRRSC